MTRVVAWVLLTGAVAPAVRCSQPQPPQPATPQQVYGELVESGCLAPDDAGPAGVEKEHARADSPAWLNCLFDGGTVAACSVPCKRSRP